MSAIGTELTEVTPAAPGFTPPAGAVPISQVVPAGNGQSNNLPTQDDSSERAIDIDYEEVLPKKECKCAGFEGLDEFRKELEEEFSGQIEYSDAELRAEFDRKIQDTASGLTVEYRSELEQTSREIRTEVGEQLILMQGQITDEYQSAIEQTAREIRTEVSHEIQDASGDVLLQSRSYTDQTAESIRQGVQSAITDSESKMRTEFNSELSQTAQEITAKVEENREYIDGTRTELQGELTVQAGLIASKVSQTDYDSDNVAREERYSQIEQTADAIQAEVVSNKQETDGDIENLRSSLEMTAENITAQVEANKADADGKFSSMQSELDITAEHIETKVSKDEYDEDNIVREQRYSQIEQTAEQIQSEVTHNKQEVDGSLVEMQSTITQQADLIATKVSRQEYDSDQSLIDDKFSTIEQTENQIRTEVVHNQQLNDLEFAHQASLIQQNADRIQTTVESSSILDGRITQAESHITQLDSEIELKASKQELDIATGQLNTSIAQLSVRTDGISASVVEAQQDLADQALLIEDLQRQIDDEITTWFWAGTPTLSNYPANEWSASDYEAHVGDLYYDNGSTEPTDPHYSPTAGQAYRFERSGSAGSYIYGWNAIADNAVAEALAKANQAQDTADSKRRTFYSTTQGFHPNPPYDQGDLWILPTTLTVGSDTLNVNKVYYCATAKAANESYASTDWKLDDDYAIEVAKANLDILADSIVGNVATYDSNTGLINNESTIAQTATSIRLSVANSAIDTAVGANGKITTPLLNTGIDILQGQIVVTANNFMVQDQQGRIALMTSGNKIKAAYLEIDGIFSTTPGSVWMTNVASLNNTAQGYADTAEGNAKDYADSVGASAVQTAATNASTYITQNVIPLINAVDGRVDTLSGAVSGLGYLADALYNGTTAIGGGLILTSLVGLGGNTGTSSAWELWSGIRALSSGETTTGIAAWYGGDAVDCTTISGWSSMTDQQKQAAWNEYRYARTLFRHDGSGYLASNNIWWGANGELHIAQSTIIGSDPTATIDNLISTVAQFASWFETAEYTPTGGQTIRYLKLKTSSTGIQGFATDGFITAGGVGTGGGGGGGGDLDVNTMYINLANGQGTDPLYYTREINVSHLHEFWKSLQNNDVVSTYNNYKIALAHIPDDDRLSYVDPEAGEEITIDDPGTTGTVLWGAESANNVALDVNGVSKTLVKQTAMDGVYSSISTLSALIGTKQNYISDLSSIRSNASLGATAHSWGDHRTYGYLTSVPTASASTLGLVRIGQGLSIDGSGIVSVTGQTQGTVTRVDVGSTQYAPDTNGVVGLPAYPTTLPASDVYAWAKEATKPSYAFSEITGTAAESQIPSLSYTKITGLGTAATRGVATTIGPSITNLVPGSLLYLVLGDSFDATNNVKAFINSSIATATATYRGNYNVVSDLGGHYNDSDSTIASEIATKMASLSITPDDNDYCFVEIPTSDESGAPIAVTKRFKYNGTVWGYEYSLNNSGFTQAQWNALNSGITSSLVAAFNAKYDKPVGGIPKSDLASAVQTSLELADTALQSHQTIYGLTIKNSAGTNELSYTPNSAAGSLTLTKAMVGLGNVENFVYNVPTGAEQTYTYPV